MKKLFGPAATIGIVLGWCASAEAQSPARAETIGAARVAIADRCPSAPRGVSDQREVAPLVGAALSFLTGVGTDLLKGGLNAAADALEAASRERAIGGQGIANHQFYALSVGGTAEAGRTVELTNNIGTGGMNCLIISIDAQPTGDPPSGLDRLPAGLDTLGIRSETWQPSVYVEVAFRSSGDAFVLLPNFVWYGQALKGLPRSAVPVELHVEFSVPGSAATSGEVFAVARIPLPPMAPGGTLNATALRGYRSYSMPLRPTAGSVETLRQAATALYTSLNSDLRSIQEHRVKQRHAQEDLDSARPPTDEMRAKPRQLQREIEILEDRVRYTRLQADLVLGENVLRNVGTTNVTARIAFIRRPNRFGLALASALRTRGPTLATNVETAITNQINSTAWTTAQTTYVSAMGQVQVAQLTYDQAMAGTDVAQQRSTLQALRNAQAAANAAAAAANRPLPYPQLLNQLGSP